MKAILIMVAMMTVSNSFASDQGDNSIVEGTACDLPGKRAYVEDTKSEDLNVYECKHVDGQLVFSFLFKQSPQTENE